MMEHVNPLARGFYSVADAARLIEVGSAPRIRGWLDGYKNSGTGPLLIRDYEPIEGRQELSFYDLMEVRFVEHFREIGVKVRTLRQLLEQARKVFSEDKPLLNRGILFVPTDDRKKVIVEEVMRPAAEANGDRRLWNLLSRQFEFDTFIEGTLARGMAFDPETEMASSWRPRPSQFPDISITPSVAYGEPTVPARIPTRTLFEAWVAEAEELPAVADWFNVPLDEVQMAVEFEKLLRNEALATDS